MSLLGNISRHNKKEPAGAPFPAGSAENGLSVDPVTGAIVLGQDVGAVGDPGQLLSNREIPFNGFTFALGEVGERYFFVNPAGEFMQLGDLDNAGFAGAQMLIDSGSGFFSATAGGNAAGLFYRLQMDIFGNGILLGDTGGNQNGLIQRLDDTAELFQVQHGVAPDRFLLVDIANDDYRFGDIDAAGNGNELFINNNSQRWSIGQSSMGSNMLLNIPSAGIGLAFFDGNGNNPFLLPDPAFGGIAFFSAPDFATQLALSDAGNGRLAQLGNIGASNNGNVFTVDDVNGIFDVDNTANNAAMRINGVNGFTGTVANPVTITVDGGIVTNVA